jgi:uncharacterized protein (DUF58 family)
VVHAGIEQSALERYVTSALLLLSAAQREGDHFGLVTFADRVRSFVRTSGGARHFAACRDTLLNLQPSEATPDIPEIVRFLRTHVRRRALIIILADVTDPVLADSFVKNSPLLARQHLVVLCQTRPDEVVPLYSGREAADIHEVYGRLAGHARWAETRSLSQRLRPLGIASVLVDNNAMAAQVIEQYLRVKRRQAL